MPPARRRFWLLVSEGSAEVCLKDPGCEVDVTVEAWGTSGTKPQAFTFVDSPGISTLDSKLLACLAVCLVAIAFYRLR